MTPRDLAVAADDNVNHPPHYTSHPSGVECIDVAEGFEFNLGQVIKYVWRAGLKTGDLEEDLKKALWYLDREQKNRALPDMEFEEGTFDALEKVVKQDDFVGKVVRAVDHGSLSAVRALLQARLEGKL